MAANCKHLWMLLKWGYCKKRSQRIVILTTHMGRGHKNVEDVNDLVVMMRTTMARIDAGASM